MTKQYKVTQEDFERVNSDTYGNPRYAIHFTLCTPDSYKYGGGGSIVGIYPSVCKLMNTIGGRKYHNKSYGGGIVFQSYNLQDTADTINKLIAEENAAHNNLDPKRKHYKYERVLLDSADNSGFENEPYFNDMSNDKERIDFIFGRFASEYQWNIDRNGELDALTDWLGGLALDIPYMNTDILELFDATEETERKQNNVLNRYFKFMAMRLLSLKDQF